MKIVYANYFLNCGNGQVANVVRYDSIFIGERPSPLDTCSTRKHFPRNGEIAGVFYAVVGDLLSVFFYRLSVTTSQFNDTIEVLLPSHPDTLHKSHRDDQLSHLIH